MVETATAGVGTGKVNVHDGRDFSIAERSSCHSKPPGRLGTGAQPPDRNAQPPDNVPFG